MRSAQAPWPGASTRLLGLLGWPARHSLSPPMHNAAFQEQGLDYVYLALPTPPDQLVRVVEALGTMEALGANVTVPHKETVIDCCDRLTEEAELVGAVNTLFWGSSGLVGDNTDAAGLAQVLRDDLGLPLESEVVVLGTGGAARAAAVALGRLHARTVFVGRRAEAAGELARLARLCGAARSGVVDVADEPQVAAAVAAASLVVNATPLGMAGERLPEPFHRLGPEHMALDLVYRPPETPFLIDAQKAGAQAHHGLGMLVAQAALSYRRWTGQAAPVATMSAAALTELSRPKG